MFAFSHVLGLALLPFVSAAVYDIQVGENGLSFTPEAISAVQGDTVVFHFKSKNHTVTQSTFASPCGPKDGGIDSGFQPVPPNSTDFPTFQVTVNDTSPIWIHCKQKTPVDHCGMGMVFAINCGQDGTPNSFTNFKKAALAIGASEASSTAAAAYPAASTPAAAEATQWTTAAYGDYTIPAAPTASLVTQTVTLGSQVWTTTYSSYPGSPDPTPASAQGNVIVVQVGADSQLSFNPPVVLAKVNDTIRFEFHQKNHSVTQSSFADPCRKLDNGFDSGFMPVDANATTFPTFDYVVKDTAPVWAYCRQPNPVSHCGAGMVMAINSVESSSRNFTAFQNVAKALNGTAAADNAPAPSSTSSSNNNNGAFSVQIGGLSATLAAATAVLALFL
jgi:plastocyanin